MLNSSAAVKLSQPDNPDSSEQLVSSESTEEAVPKSQAAIAVTVGNEESEKHIYQQKEYFKREGTAVQHRENLQKLMLKIYKQSSHSDIFYVNKIQNCLDKLRNSLSLKEATTTLRDIRNKCNRISELDAIDRNLNEMQLVVLQQQAAFESTDVNLIHQWFFCAIESIAKLKEAIEIQRKVINYKTEYLLRMEHILNGGSIDDIPEIFTQASFVLEELKCLVEADYRASLEAYSYIEDRVEILLRNLQSAISSSFTPATGVSLLGLYKGEPDTSKYGLCLPFSPAPKKI